MAGRLGDQLLLEAEYGKTRVRLVKVAKHGAHRHSVWHFDVECLLRGDFAETYLTGDNRRVVPTDTVKNTIYLLARQHEFRSAEDFAVLVCRHFLEKHAHISAVTTSVEQRLWKRTQVQDQEHGHVFQPETFHRMAEVCATRAKEIASDVSAIRWKIAGGIKELTLLKTTGSGFADFLVDEATSLKPALDRLLCTSVDAKWEYARVCSDGDERVDYNDFFNCAAKTLVEEFAGPAATGRYSKSVQETMYLMAEALFRDSTLAPHLQSVSLRLPNIHHIEVDQSPFGVINNGTVFHPTDAPSGLIKCTLRRRPQRENDENCAPPRSSEGGVPAKRVVARL